MNLHSGQSGTGTRAGNRFNRSITAKLARIGLELGAALKLRSHGGLEGVHVWPYDFVGHVSMINNRVVELTPREISTR